MADPMSSAPNLWKIPPEAKAKYDEQFFQLKPVNGYVTGDQAKHLFLQSGLPPQILAHIWALGDVNCDGKMDQQEFAIAMYLIQLKLKGFELPKLLPPSLLAPQQPLMTGIRPPPGPMGIGAPIAAPTSFGTAFVRPASPVDAKLQKSGSISCGGSPTSAHAPPLIEWAISQQAKLKYTQLFNSFDRARTGYITGPQAKNILMQSGLPQPVLAQIWSLSDIDSDGRLSCEEFVVAMYLTETVKAGDALPRALPTDLIPPSYRRKRSSSVQSLGSNPGLGLGDGIGIDAKEEERIRTLETFEDKRRQNFEKGQAELEKRRLALLESQRKEQEEREKKEREEQERKERIRQEQERRRQLELEKQLAKQRELEQEKEEQRRKAIEQREAARREMERQRQLEWERQRRQELLTQQQLEQEAVCHLKNRNKNVTYELEKLTNEINEINQKIGDIRKNVSQMKSSIDDMRTLRDTKLTELNHTKQNMQELNEKLLLLNQEKIKLNTKLNDASQSDPTIQSYNSVMHTFNNKEITMKQLHGTLDSINAETIEKEKDVESGKSQLKDLKQQLNELTQNFNKTLDHYKQRRQQIMDSGNQTINDITSHNALDKNSLNNNVSGRMLKYRALYAFEARNPDELSIMPGDVIMVPESQSSEPGWLGGELHGSKGWFPEAYAELIQSPTDGESSSGYIPNGGVNQAETVHIVGTEMKRTLEGISEAPENITEVPEIDSALCDTLQPSENSSFTQLPKYAPLTAEAASPIPGQGQAVTEVLQAQALFPWKAKKDNHLTFNKGDVIEVKEQQDMWWYGEFQGKLGWFPKSYVKPLTGDLQSGFGNDMGFSDQSNLIDPSCHYISSYSYESEEPGDLCFQQGEIVLVTKSEGEWWTGKVGNKTGIFPSNYVRQLEPDEIKNIPIEKIADLQLSDVPPATPPEISLPITNTTTTSSINTIAPVGTNAETNLISPKPSEPCSTPSEQTETVKRPEIVTVIAPYQATGSEQLTLERGQLIQVRKKTPSGWWEGEVQVKGQKRQIGWFPASYVKILATSACSSGDKSFPGTYMQNNGEENEKVLAVYSFTAQHSDELTFQKGEMITIISKEDPAWWKGEIDGVVGLFPSNYAEPLK